MAKWHQKKEISDAIEYALDRGWRLEKAGGHAHNWGTLYCPESSRDGHLFFVRSTPRNPGSHAKNLRKTVDDCPHSNPAGSAGTGKADLP